jgi:hypothetical protein
MIATLNGRLKLRVPIAIRHIVLLPIHSGDPSSCHRLSPRAAKENRCENEYKSYVLTARALRH